MTGDAYILLYGYRAMADAYLHTEVLAELLVDWGGDFCRPERLDALACNREYGVVGAVFVRREVVYVPPVGLECAGGCDRVDIVACAVSTYSPL